jgi:hypothetical protein
MTIYIRIYFLILVLWHSLGQADSFISAILALEREDKGNDWNSTHIKDGLFDFQKIITKPSGRIKVAAITGGVTLGTIRS